MNKTKKIYQHAGKFYGQQNLKDILDTAVVSTKEGVTYNSPNMDMTKTPVKKPSASKSLCLFTNILDNKEKTEKRGILDTKSKRRAMKVGTSLWTKGEKSDSKIN